MAGRSRSGMNFFYPFPLGYRAGAALSAAA
jgi:hypothetical protein